MARRDPETNPAAFSGGELRRARMAAGFSSQDALAARLGFDRTVIAKAETGERPPTGDVLAAWCVACRLPRAVAVRDSKDPHGPVLAMEPAGWRNFIAEVKAGRHDLT